MKRMSLFGSITMGLFLVLVLAFQNCNRITSPLQFSEKSSVQNSTDDPGGNGHPYDGKIYVLLTNSCPDGTRIQGKIELQRSSASLLRENCQDITPRAISSTEYTVSANDPTQLHYQNQTYVIVGTLMDMNLVSHEDGFSYKTQFDFGTPSNGAQNGSYISRLQIYENGKALGPAHEDYDDVRFGGRGLFNYWEGILYFSARDNSNPLTNGRIYTYEILSQPAPLPVVTITSIQATSDANNIYFQYNFTGPIQFHRLFLNTDNNASTGYVGRIGIGADFIIESGSFRRYTGANGAWGWTVIKLISSTVNGNTIRVTLPKSEINSPASIDFVFEIAGDSGGAKSIVYNLKM